MTELEVDDNILALDSDDNYTSIKIDLAGCTP